MERLGRIAGGVEGLKNKNASRMLAVLRKPTVLPETTYTPEVTKCQELKWENREALTTSLGGCDGALTVVVMGSKPGHARPACAAQVRSLKDCGFADTWIKRLEILKKTLSEESITAVNVVPHDGTHFRHTHVELILELLGLKPRFTYRKRHLYKIDEVVENRNSIAHGDETAIAVGKRYSRSDVFKDIRLMKSICFRLIALLSEHCSDPARHVA
jgi:hypothetical protein